ncbi:MAG: repeat-containing protein [Bryobacterales bacterium]|nr:repeat-containing protein [Bryobacterales bacterium]
MQLTAVAILSAAGSWAQRPPNAEAASLNFSLGGKIAMDDGSAIPPRIAVLLSCSSAGGRALVSYTNATGQFSFPSQNSSVQDCVVQASAKGYTSEPIGAMKAISSGSGNVGILKLHRLSTTQGVTTSQTSLTAPKDATKAFEQGMALVKKGKPEAAVKDFEKATTIYPKFAEAWYQLGRSQLAAAANDAAIVSLKKAVEADPLLVGPQVQLGILAGQRKDWAESAKLLDVALELDPVDYPTAWFPDAVANLNLQKYDQAEKAAREALRLDPEHKNPKVEYVLGLALAEKADLKGAAAAMKSYLAHAPKAPDADHVREMIAQFEATK